MAPTTAIFYLNEKRMGLHGGARNLRPQYGGLVYHAAQEHKLLDVMFICMQIGQNVAF